MISEEIYRIQWFSKVGKGPRSSLSEWDDWPGPEDYLCEPIGELTQKYFDEYASISGLDNEKFIGLVECILDDVSDKFEFDRNEDCYDPKCAAAWEVAWWACLYGLYEKDGREVPVEIKRFYSYIKDGFWPYGIDSGGNISYF